MSSHRRTLLHALPGYLHGIGVSVSTSRRRLNCMTCLRRFSGGRLDLWLPQQVFSLKSGFSKGKNRSERVLTGKKSVVQGESQTNESPDKYDQ